MKKQKVVLAFSGGLDTSYCVKYFTTEMKLDVFTVTVNTGGFTTLQLEELSKKALQLGAKSHKTIDMTCEYYYKCIRYLIYGNVLKNHTYPLSVSAERVFQAMAVANFAGKIKADYLAHGSTGAGNDQVRFDIVFNIMTPDIPVLTPIRDQKLGRDEETRFLEKHGVVINGEQTIYSINKGLWGTSIGGKETLTSKMTLPEQAYPTVVSKNEKEKIEIYFKNGQLSGFDGQDFSKPVEAIHALNEVTSSFGIGRDVHVGDTIIGIKGRVGFEAAAPILIIKAHEALEKHVLTKWQIHWKEQLANWYGMLLHEGQYLDPVMRNIEVFLENTQEVVNGTVFIELAPYRFKILGIESPNDLMISEFGQYGEINNSWTGQDVRGFAKILSNQSKIFRLLNQRERNA